MSTTRIDKYAIDHNISNNEAKRRLRGWQKRDAGWSRPERGAPVAGTGKPRGQKKAG